MILKLRNVNFKSNILTYVDVDNMLISEKVSSVKKNYEYFISYMDDDHKIKSFSIILLKRSQFIKNYDGESKWIYFFIKVDELLKNTVIFRIESVMKTQFKSELIYNKNF